MTGNRKSRLLALTGVCFYTIAVVNDRPAMYVLCGVTVSLMLLCFILSRLGAHGLRIERAAELPERLTAGQPLPLGLALTNLGSLPKTSLLVSDRIENETAGEQTQRTVLVEWLAGESTLRVDGGGYLARRGWVQLGPVSVGAGDPLGMFERTRIAESATHRLLVRPRVVPLPLLQAAGGQGGAAQNRERTASGFELREVREYQPGDALRHVDWKVTARTGRLHIREFETPSSHRAAVLLDLHADQVFGAGETGSLETAVSAAASVALRLAELGFGVRLLADDGQRLDMTLGPQRSPAALLDRLAIVRGGGSVALDRLLPLCGGASTPAVLVAVTARSDAALAETLARYAAARPVLVLALRGPAFAGREGDGDGGRFRQRLESAGATVVVLGPGDDLGAGVRLSQGARR